MGELVHFAIAQEKKRKEKLQVDDEKFVSIKNNNLKRPKTKCLNIRKS